MTDTSKVDPNRVPFSGLFVHVTVGGKLFSAAELGLQKVLIIDADEGDNTVELHCLDMDYKIADSGFFKEGNVLSIKWGYSTPQLSASTRSGYVIMKPSTDYSSNGVVSTIKAKTKGSTLNAHRPAKSWGKTTVYRVMQDLVASSGLQLVMTDRHETLTGFSQGNLSTRLAMRQLAERFGYTITWDSETVVVEPIDYSQTPKVLLVYGLGGNIEKANVNNDNHSDGGAGSNTQMVGFDPANKLPLKGEGKDAGQPTVGLSLLTGHRWFERKPTEAEQTPGKGGSAVSTPAGTPGTSGELPKVSSMPSWMTRLGNAVGGVTPDLTESLDPESIKLLRSTPESVQANVDAHATSTKLRGKKKKAGLTVTSRGIVAAKARIVVEVRGLAKRDSGNWYVSKVTHEVDLPNSNYTCDWELNRHGKNTAGTPNPGQVNNKKVPGSEDPKKSTATVNVVTGAHGPS